MADFVYEIPVRFADVDRAGILYYPRFINYFHVAFEEFFGGALGVPYPETIEGDRVAFPMVRLEVDFKSPLAFGDHALVTVRLVRIGTTSVEFAYEVHSKRSGVLAARARAVTVSVHLDTLKKLELPRKYRDLFERQLAAQS